MNQILPKVSILAKEISQEFPTFVESGSEFIHFIPEPRNFAEVKQLLDDIKKP